jgi:protein PhnA
MKINKRKVEITVSSLPSCPQCGSAYTYEDGHMLICPECAHEWNDFTEEAKALENAVKDAVGNVLSEGDDAIMVKQVKISGGSGVIKQGTQVKGIRLETNGPHNIVARVDGFGIMELKSELVKKV